MKMISQWKQAQTNVPWFRGVDSAYALLAKGTGMRRTWRTLRTAAPLLVAAGLIGASASVAVAAPAFPVVPIESVAGPDRYATAVAASKAAHPGSAGAVVLATGLAWPDALAGAGLAGTLGAPVLLTNPGYVPPAVVAEIVRLGADEVFVLGSTAAVSAQAVAGLQRAIPSVRITRLAGADRYQTASAVAAATVARNPSWDGVAFVATGGGFADALSAGPIAAALGRPVYLVDATSRLDGVLASMHSVGVRQVVILGSAAAVSAPVATRVAGVVGGASNVTRLEGSDRYGTAIAIAAYAERSSGFSWACPGLATGEVFADGLAAAPLLGARRVPLLMTPRAGLSDTIASALLARSAGVQGLTVFGSTAAVPAHVREEAQVALIAPTFNTGRAMGHIESITGIGPRGAGTAAERLCADYVAAELTRLGYTVRTQTVTLPGKTSRNVIAEKVGSRPEVIVLGAHIDTKPPSPGANDNASGVAVMLELARDLATAPVRPTVRFIAFGAEEIAGTSADDHHFGSRQYVASLSTAERDRISAMISIDMVGYGSTFNVRTMGVGTRSVVDSLQARGSFTGQALPYLRDPGRYGWSDHEGFERAGIPAAWLEWREDPVYHTTRDIASHVQTSRIRASGRLLHGWLLGMSDAQLDALR